MDWFHQSSAYVENISSQLRAKLHSFLCDGLELVVPSPIHVEIILDEKDQMKTVSKKERRHLKYELNRLVDAEKSVWLSKVTNVPTL